MMRFATCPCAAELWAELFPLRGGGAVLKGAWIVAPRGRSVYVTPPLLAEAPGAHVAMPSGTAYHPGPLLAAFKASVAGGLLLARHGDHDTAAADAPGRARRLGAAVRSAFGRVAPRGVSGPKNGPPEKPKPSA